MYKSIIDIIHTDMEVKMDGEIMKAVQRCNIEVDKEELLKALQYDRGQYQKGYQDGLNADKWIPCEERLPNTRNNILICQSDGYVGVGYYSQNVFKDENSYLYENVIAWQPLPQPYKKEGAE